MMGVILDGRGKHENSNSQINEDKWEWTRGEKVRLNQP
jgi:hypothetical protein